LCRYACLILDDESEASTEDEIEDGVGDIDTVLTERVGTKERSKAESLKLEMFTDAKVELAVTVKVYRPVPQFCRTGVER